MLSGAAMRALIVPTGWYTVTPVPFAMEHADRAPKERYYDPEFYRLEADQLWPRAWQMACRLEEIPEPFDFVTYDFLDQSVVVVRRDDGGVDAFQNACRHRGVRVAVDRGRCESGFTCPFHGWCYGADGTNTFVTRPKTFDAHNLDPGDVNLVPVRAETWGGCAFINLDETAPPLRECIEPFATVMDAWNVEAMRTEWWYAARLPVNWKLAEEAFMEQYHVLEAHPQLRLPGRMPPREGKPWDSRAWVEAELDYLRLMSEGMAGMPKAWRPRSSCPTTRPRRWRSGTTPSTTRSSRGTAAPARSCPTSTTSRPAD